MATELVGRAVAALNSAAIRSREHSITAMLTRAILPERLPGFDGLEIAARYLPGEDGPVGGDWYDVFEVRGGRLGLVVGDASGHGVEAASLMVRLRNGLRAYAAGGDRPSAVLRQLAELVDAPDADWDDEAAFATVAYAQHDQTAGSLAIASAGHPPALRVSSGRARFSRPGGRPLLKGFAPPRLADRAMTLHDGDLMVLYSDGLVEDPGRSIEEGMARLASAVVEASEQGLEDLCDTVIEKTRRAANRRDDCCLLVVRVSGGAGGR
jgi:serine phosphatase RsbU (regulator of sigma subunit)